MSAAPWTRKDLPLLGVAWRRFDTEHEAKAFADWAERTTANDERPCDVSYYPADGGWEVRVANW